jgi:hypothetical protein
MPQDVQRKISYHDLKATVENYNKVESRPLDPESLKTWVNQKMRQVRLNVAARDLVKAIESTTDEFRRNGCRLRDNKLWCAFYVAVKDLDSETAE